MRERLAFLALAVLAQAALAQDRPLVIPQVEGAKQGRLVGRAIACGVSRERTDVVVRASRERMLRAVGPAFTEDRYLPELDRAIRFETGLPRPSDAACAKALSEFEALEGAR